LALAALLLIAEPARAGSDLTAQLDALASPSFASGPTDLGRKLAATAVGKPMADPYRPSAPRSRSLPKFSKATWENSSSPPASPWSSQTLASRSFGQAMGQPRFALFASAQSEFSVRVHRTAS